MKTVVFVCTGNTCRSPMAEGIFRALLREKGIGGVECLSCGLYASSGAPASGRAVLAARAYGADISGHRTRPLTDELLERGDLFVGMTKWHAEELAAKYRVPREKLIALDIADPCGGDETEYAECAADIRAALLRLLSAGGCF